jgi:ADP-heptose:LPS heptosyltransferase
MMARLTVPRTIAVFRALQLGDLLCTVPALRALKRAFPSARLTLIGLPWAASFAARFRRYVDDFLEFPGYPGLPERVPDAARVPGFFVEAQARRFDLALQLHGSGSYVNSIVALLGARRTAGYYVPGEWCPDPETFIPYPAAEHEVRQPLVLLEALGIPACGEELEFPFEAADEAALDALPGARTLGRAFVCVHAGARLRSRRWLPERFAATADAVAEAGYPVVLTGGPEEIELVSRVEAAMRRRALNLAGRTTLGSLAALVSRARLLVWGRTLPAGRRSTPEGMKRCTPRCRAARVTTTSAPSDIPARPPSGRNA